MGAIHSKQPNMDYLAIVIHCRKRHVVIRHRTRYDACSSIGKYSVVNEVYIGRLLVILLLSRCYEVRKGIHFVRSKKCEINVEKKLF